MIHSVAGIDHASPVTVNFSRVKAVETHASYLFINPETVAPAQNSRKGVEVSEVIEKNGGDDGARTRPTGRQGVATPGKCRKTRRADRWIWQPEAGVFRGMLARGLHRSGLTLQQWTQ
jgi:hypothetical protein